jgi:hypothetical protein
LRHYLIALFFLASACVSTTDPETALRAQRNATPSSPCERQSASRCLFFNAPVSLFPRVIRLKARPLPFFRTEKPLEFVDSRPTKWLAPKNTLTDGASIPSLFLTAVGNPRSKEFINAATIHDAYCGIGNESLSQYHSDTWQNVHRMFYDALRVSGTPSAKAKIMYAAVYLGGPRWTMPGEQPKVRMPIPGLLIVTAPLKQGPPNTPLPRLIPEKVLIEEMVTAVNFINNSNPSFSRLSSYLRKREQYMLNLVRVSSTGTGDDLNNSITSPNPSGGYSLPDL